MVASQAEVARMNIAETAYAMTPDALMAEAQRQFAIADAVGKRHHMNPLWQRGGWFLLLVHAQVTDGVAGTAGETKGGKTPMADS
jgi:hypothetical protein